MGGLEILPAAEVVDEVGDGFVGVGEFGIREEPLVEP